MRRLLTGLAGTVLILSGIEPALAITLSLEPASQTIFTGDTATVDVKISDLGDLAPDSLGAFDLDITYDDSIVTFASIDFGTHLGDPSFFEAFTIVGTTAAGVVDFAEVSLLFDFELDALQPSSFTLATLTFTGKSEGSSLLEVTRDPFLYLGDAFGDPFFDLILKPGSITVEARESQTTPESSTSIGTALILGLVGLCKKQKKIRS